MSDPANHLKVLLIEDDQDDYALTLELLQEAYGDDFSLTWFDNWSKGSDALNEGEFDVCLLDYQLGEHNGLKIVQDAKLRGIATPIVLLTGLGSREIDLEAMRAGAADYLEKGKIDAVLLERSIRYALKAKEITERSPDVMEGGVPRLLLVEDDEDDYLITNDLLSDIYGADFKLDWVRTEEDALSAISKGEHDVYLVDYRLGKTNGLDLVQQVSETWSTAPFILLTGQNSRELDIEAMRAGASDYLVKDDLTAPLLDRAIRYAIERYRGEQKLARMAQFDQLTGLANRSLFRDYLERALARADRTERSVAVFFLDLDRFKIINDTFGHDTGDALLIEVAERLRHSVRASDLVARLGGDEFTVVVDGITSPYIVHHFADRILRVLKEPLRLGENELFTTASIGIAVYPNDADNLDDLLKSADTAMYKAKEEGANNYQFYTVDLHIKASKRAELERGLRSAIDNREFEVWYQPQIDIETGELSAVEALVRWAHPERGLIMPDAFIGLAEETGLIVPIGELVMDDACRKIREFESNGVLELNVAVNFSARQFQDANLVENISSIVEGHGVNPSLLEIEITENSILEDPQTVRRTLESFTDMGLRVALDDFGTGYSSLKHLRSFPAGSIKIDRSFIQNVSTSPEDASIVRAIIGMAHNLRLKVIAEGVETTSQLEFLRQLNCDAVQGYYFSKPLRPEEVTPIGMQRFLSSASSSMLKQDDESAEPKDDIAGSPLRRSA